jgi:hypothetical protein
MWAFTNPETRPDYIIFTFLPISFLTGVIGGIYLWYVEKNEKRLSVVVPEKDLENGEGSGRSSQDGTLGAVVVPLRDNWTSEIKL